MYVVIEMTANRHDPEGYGAFVKVHALIDDDHVTAYNIVCNLLGVDRAKMVHTMGIIGASNAGMAGTELQGSGEVQLFAEFRDSRRFWIFQVSPESAR